MSWNYYADRSLREFGVSNNNMSFQELVSAADYVTVAYCTSPDCCAFEKDGKIKYLRKVVVEQPGPDDSCPRCGYYLHYEQVKKRFRDE